MPRKPLPIDESLRRAIAADGRTHYAIAAAAGIAPSQIDRFMLPLDDPRHRDLRLGTASSIAAALRLGLVKSADGRSG